MSSKEIKRENICEMESNNVVNQKRTKSDQMNVSEESEERANLVSIIDDPSKMIFKLSSNIKNKLISSFNNFTIFFLNPNELIKEKLKEENNELISMLFNLEPKIEEEEEEVRKKCMKTEYNQSNDSKSVLELDNKFKMQILNNLNDNQNFIIHYLNKMNQDDKIEIIRKNTVLINKLSNLGSNLAERKVESNEFNASINRINKNLVNSTKEASVNEKKPNKLLKVIEIFCKKNWDPKFTEFSGQLESLSTELKREIKDVEERSLMVKNEELNRENEDLRNNLELKTTEIENLKNNYKTLDEQLIEFMIDFKLQTSNLIKQINDLKKDNEKNPNNDLKEEVSALKKNLELKVQDIRSMKNNCQTSYFKLVEFMNNYKSQSSDINKEINELKKNNQPIQYNELRKDIYNLENVMELKTKEIVNFKTDIESKIKDFANSFVYNNVSDKNLIQEINNLKNELQSFRNSCAFTREFTNFKGLTNSIKYKNSGCSSIPFFWNKYTFKICCKTTYFDNKPFLGVSLKAIDKNFSYKFGELKLNVNFELKLLNQSGGEDKCEKYQAIFDKKNIFFGNEKFIDYPEIFDDRNGYYKNESIFLRVLIQNIRVSYETSAPDLKYK